MNRPRSAVVGLAAAAIVGSAAPAWSFWTLTSHIDATAGAKADMLNAPTVQSMRTGNGNDVVVTFRIVAAPGAVPSNFTVSRKGSQDVFAPLAGCTDIPTTMDCTATTRENNGSQTYRIVSRVGTFWISGTSVCDYDNTEDKPEGDDSLNCSPLVTMSALGSSKVSAPPDSSTSNEEPGKMKSSDPSTTPSVPAPAEPSAPAAPSAPKVLAADDFGSSDSDGITNAANPRLVGEAESGSEVIVYNGAAEIGRITATADGTYELPTELAEGNHDLTAVASNAGGTSGPSAVSVVRIDRTAPALSVEANGTGAERTVTGTLGTAAGDAQSVTLDLDNDATLGAIDVGADGAYEAAVEVQTGTTTVTATQTDEAGNVATATVTIERAAEQATDATAEGDEAQAGEPAEATSTKPPAP